MPDNDPTAEPTYDPTRLEQVRAAAADAKTRLLALISHVEDRYRHDSGGWIPRHTGADPFVEEAIEALVDLVETIAPGVHNVIRSDPAVLPTGLPDAMMIREIDASSLAAVSILFGFEDGGKYPPVGDREFDQLRANARTLARHVGDVHDLEAVRDTEPRAANLNETEQAIVDALEGEGERMTTERLLDKALGTVNGHGKSTLSSLRKRGVIDNSPVLPRGYGLPEWSEDGQDHGQDHGRD